MNWKADIEGEGRVPMNTDATGSAHEHSQDDDDRWLLVP
jgi:hypothetical protein